MPRIEKANRTSLPTADTSYDLNNNFESYTGLHSYKKSSNLLLWGDLCEPLAADIADHTPADTGFTLQGSDRAIAGQKNGIYVKTSDKSTSFDAGNSVQLPPGFELTGFCGFKCYQVFSGIAAPLGGTRGWRYNLSKHFVINAQHSDFDFVDGTGKETGFSVSLWLRPGFFSLNQGGDDTAGVPSSYYFHKYLNYSLAIGADRRLRFTVHCQFTPLSNFLYVESEVDSFSSTSDGVWQNVIVTYDGSGVSTGLKIFVNGNDKTATHNTSGTFTNYYNKPTQLLIGQGHGGAFSAMPSGNTGLAEPAIWNAALGEEDVKAIYNASQTCPVNNLKNASGYTSLSPRVRLKTLDSATGSYPSVLRTGDKDFKGDFAHKFDDTNVLIFGEKIVDEFSNIEFNESASTRIDPSIWHHSSGTFLVHGVDKRFRGLEIRKERSTFLRNVFPPTDGVLVFSGITPRYITTKRKVRNAKIYLELLQGPHDQGGTALASGLNLSGGKPGTDNLKIQYNTVSSSPDHADWKTLRTFIPDLNLDDFYDNIAISGNGTDSAGNPIKRRKIVEIDYSEINAGDNDYYIRVIQENALDDTKAVWGINRISIESMNQKIRYPLLIDHDSSVGRFIDKLAIASPHTRSTLTAVGRTIPGTSDTMIHFTPGENISPFDERDMIENLDPTNFFHAIGSHPETGVVGYGNRLADKTKIVINLPQTGVTTIGHTDIAPASPPDTVNPLDPLVAGLGFVGFPPTLVYQYRYKHDLMCLYNVGSDTWSTLSFPPCVGGLDSINPGHNHLDTSFVETEAHLGFGPIDIVATRSDGPGPPFTSNTIVEQFGKDVLSNYVRPTKTFGFPFDKKYALPKEKTILASDYINKPFLIEKIVVAFSASFEFARNGTDGEHSYGLHQNFRNTDTGYPSTRRSVNGHRVIIPTFFAINQFNDPFDVSYDFQGERTPTENYKVNYSSEQSAREMISYGQMTLFMSSSQGDHVDIEAAIEDGLGRDMVLNVLERTGQSTDGLPNGLSNINVNSITGSFRLEFPCRVSPKTKFTQRVLVISGTSGSPSTGQNVGIWMSDQSGGRNYEGMERGNRGLINNYPGNLPGKKYRTFSINNLADPREVESVSHKGIDQYSPYILFPGDQLIFGWQYPINASYATHTNGLGHTGAKNIMNIIGDSKVYLYGSLMSDNQEYHEYRNQPLTSDAIHEVIGAEKPIDKFQIASRGELSGSFIDQMPTAMEYYDGAPGSPSTAIQVASKLTENPLLRVGNPVYSIVGGADYTGAVNASRRVERVLAEVDQLQRFFKLRDSSRFYFDSVFGQGAIHHPGSGSYGTMQTYYNITSSHLHDRTSLTRPEIGYFDVTKENNFIHRRARPKYYFNYENFGQSFDFYQQGRDSIFYQTVVTDDGFEFTASPTSDDFTDIIGSPVRVRFASSSLVEDPRIKIYNEVSPDDLFAGKDATSFKTHVPYNLTPNSLTEHPFEDPDPLPTLTYKIVTGTIYGM